MINESILKPTLLSFNILPCKTHVARIFPNFVFFSGPYIMQKLQILVYSYKHIYSVSN